MNPLLTLPSTRGITLTALGLNLLCELAANPNRSMIDAKMLFGVSERTIANLCHRHNIDWISPATRDKPLDAFVLMVSTAAPLPILCQMVGIATRPMRRTLARLNAVAIETGLTAYFIPLQDDYTEVGREVFDAVLDIGRAYVYKVAFREIQGFLITPHEIAGDGVTVLGVYTQQVDFPALWEDILYARAV